MIEIPSHSVASATPRIKNIESTRHFLASKDGVTDAQDLRGVTVAEWSIILRLGAWASLSAARPPG